jgi:hypothetical protein
MGPAWFLLHPARGDVFFDGAPPLEEEKEDPTKKRDTEILALMLLMEDCP